MIFKLKQRCAQNKSVVEARQGTEFRDIRENHILVPLTPACRAAAQAGLCKV